jgi:hypothetical protein
VPLKANQKFKSIPWKINVTTVKMKHNALSQGNLNVSFQMTYLKIKLSGCISTEIASQRQYS